MDEDDDPIWVMAMTSTGMLVRAALDLDLEEDGDDNNWMKMITIR